MEYKNIKWKVGLPYVVRLLNDKPEEKTGKYGKFQEYTVEYEGEEYKFIASEGLHNSLLGYEKGDLLEIIKSEGDENKTYFEVEQLSEDDIKSTELEKSPGKAEIGPDWDKINADKQHSITLAIAMKLAVQSMPAKVKDLDYEEIELRMVKFNAIMEKYLGVVMPEQKFSPAIQKEWDAFHKWIEDNKNVLKQGTYDTAMIWLKGLEKPTVEKLLLNRAKIQAQIKGNTSSGEYESYHDSLITGCCEILKTENRLPVIQTLDNMVKAWGVEGLEKLSETSENQCQNLVDEFDKAQKEEEDLNLPY